jgi:uncharacterized membrane protein YccC
MADVAALQQLAEQAADSLTQLAEGLHAAAADPEAVKAIQQMAQSCTDIAGQLGGSAKSAAPAEQKPQRPATMQSATNDMVADQRAGRGGK